MSGRLVEALRWIVFATAALALNFPVLSTLVTSLKTEAEITASPSLVIHQPTFANYQRVFDMADRFDILAYLWNSLVASSIGAGLAILLAFPAAYAVGRLGYGRSWLMPVAVNIRAVPLIIFAIPLYLMYQAFSLLDTRLGLGLVLAVVNVPLMLVLLAGAVAEIPDELEEAARVDGAGTLQILRHVILPLSRSVLASALVLGFITAWNEFLFGLMLTTRSAVPVTVGASFFFAASGGGVQWGVAAAVMMLSTLPPVLLGLLMYRQIGSTMAEGAVKG
jgi:multiple sugar transport system permease protein